MSEGKIALTLEVDKYIFESYVMNSLVEIPKEKIQDIILESIRDYFTADNFKNLEKLLVEPDTYSYSNTKRPSKFLQNIMDANVNLDDKLKPIVDDAAKFMKENYSALIVDSLTNIMLSSFFNHPSLDISIREGMRANMLSMIKDFDIKTKYDEN